MPIYEYQCQACEQVSDALQKMSDDPLVTCPECNEDALKKLISAPRFRLAGSGWYETDFKSDNQRNLAKSDSDKSGDKSSANSEAVKSDSKQSNSKESKKETKTEAKSSASKSSDKTAA